METLSEAIQTDGLLCQVCASTDPFRGASWRTSLCKGNSSNNGAIQGARTRTTLIISKTITIKTNMLKLRKEPVNII